MNGKLLLGPLANQEKKGQKKKGEGVLRLGKAPPLTTFFPQSARHKISCYCSLRPFTRTSDASKDVSMDLRWRSKVDEQRASRG